jgi:hypothetical protein
MFKTDEQLSVADEVLAKLETVPLQEASAFIV